MIGTICKALKRERYCLKTFSRKDGPCFFFAVKWICLSHVTNTPRWRLTIRWRYSLQLEIGHRPALEGLVVGGSKFSYRHSHMPGRWLKYRFYESGKTRMDCVQMFLWYYIHRSSGVAVRSTFLGDVGDTINTLYEGDAWRRMHFGNELFSINFSTEWTRRSMYFFVNVKIGSEQYNTRDTTA